MAEGALSAIKSSHGQQTKVGDVGGQQMCQISHGEKVLWLSNTLRVEINAWALDFSHASKSAYLVRQDYHFHSVGDHHHHHRHHHNDRCDSFLEISSASDENVIHASMRLPTRFFRWCERAGGQKRMLYIKSIIYQNRLATEEQERWE
jgi:hypothetical protein